MEETIIGYQFSPVDSRFIGEYRFPKNQCSDKIHMPPNTTLVKPPEDKPNGKEFFWLNDQWVLRDDGNQRPEKPMIEDYAMLADWYIDHLKSNGLWDENDEQLLIEHRKEWNKKDARAKHIAKQAGVKYVG